MFLYQTVEKMATAEQTIKKSRFIGHVQPVSNREEAETFFAQIRAEHRQATHNVPAFVIGDQFQLQWASDDGEPAGTAGAPAVQLLVKEGITNAALVITRYYGGIQLGTGGLVRAYTGTARLALAVAGVCRVEEQLILPVRMDYSFLGKLKNMAEEGWFQLQNIRYEDLVTLEIAAPTQMEQRVHTMLDQLTGATATLLDSRTAQVRIPL